jgi:hypothetical protein
MGMRKAGPGRPRKPPGKAKGVLIQVRVEPKDKKDFMEAASLLGLQLSGWVRMGLRDVVQRDLAKFQRSPHFLT